MRGAANAVDERNSERMHFRTKPRIKRAIQEAAALSGLDDSTFTMNAAYRSALETIAAHERTMLRPLDHAVFFAALDAPPAPTPRLRAAVEQHDRTVATK
jgi:uncharacterized protein (DUF1778 family)